MTNQEILEKAIDKAIAGGYKVSKYDLTELWTPYEVIFNHDFAKAFFGEYKATKRKFEGKRYQVYETNKGWKRHLQLMVIADDPIAYLGENI